MPRIKKNYWRVYGLLVVLFSLLFASPLWAKVCIYEISGKPTCTPLARDLTPEQERARCNLICGSPEVVNCRVDNACPVMIENPIGSTGGQIDIPVFIGTAVSRILVVVGAITLLVFVWGGVTWIESAGSEERVRKGAQIMLFAVVGLVVIFASYGILTIVIQGLRTN